MAHGQAGAEIYSDGSAPTLTCLHEAPIVSGTLSGLMAKGGMSGQEPEHLVAHTLRAEGFDASEDGPGRGTPLVPVARQTFECAGCRRVIDTAWGWGQWCDYCGHDHAAAMVPVHREVAPTLTGNYGKQPDSSDTSAGPTLIPVAYRTAGDGCVYEEGDRSAPLTTGTDPSANIIAFGCKDSDPARGVSDDISPTLRAMGHSGSHANAGGQVAVAFAQNTRDEVREMPYVGALAAEPGMKQTSYIRQEMAVRRLTPRECERLQGFPDDYTLIPWRGRDADQCPDGPRYKALGNSMAVPVMAWIGRRIEFILMRLAA